MEEFYKYIEKRLKEEEEREIVGYFEDWDEMHHRQQGKIEMLLEMLIYVRGKLNE